jgi:arylsulfatase A-like enzyme
MKPTIISKFRTSKAFLSLLVGVAALVAVSSQAFAQQQKRPNVVVLMGDDLGWSDFGAYTGGGSALGHPTPNIDRLAKEGVLFTSWYGQSSCTAGRSSFQTGRIPIRSALSVVVAPGDENGLKKETPTIAEFFKKNGYTTYFSGKWHLGDKPEMYPIEHGYDEMRQFAAYYPGVYTYDDTSPNFHPWFPKYNAAFWKEFRTSSTWTNGKAWPEDPPPKSRESTGTTWPSSTCDRQIRRSRTSSSTRRAPRSS